MICKEASHPFTLNGAVPQIPLAMPVDLGGDTTQLGERYHHLDPGKGLGAMGIAE